MYTIVALGNPGDDYEMTRHNAGRIVLSEILKADGLDSSEERSLKKGKAIELGLGRETARILWPHTYMNESGRAITQLMPPVEPDELVVIYDDIDLPFGEFKLSFDRGDGGHNGLRSIISSLDTREFARLRVGIAPKTFWGKTIRPQGEELARYVLGRLSRSELSKLSSVASTAKDALRSILEEGIERAMNRFN